MGCEKHTKEASVAILVSWEQVVTYQVREELGTRSHRWCCESHDYGIIYGFKDHCGFLMGNGL
jgi:hypothetical protein